MWTRLIVLRAIRYPKDTLLAHRAINGFLRRGLREARATGACGALLERPAFYAVERRVNEYLARLRRGQALDSSGAPGAVLAGFELLRDAMVYLRDTAPAHGEARGWNSRLNRLERCARVERLRSYPPAAYVELTNECNERCPICPQSLLPDSVPRSWMDAAVFRALLPYLKWMETVHLFGFGESLLSPLFPELLDAVAPETRSVLITNGLLLTPPNIRLLVDRGLHALYVSADGATRGTYARMRGIDALEQVFANVAALTAYRRERASVTPRIAFNFAAGRRNLAELPDFIRRAKALGADEVNVGHLVAISEDFHDETLFFDQERADRLLAEAARLGDEVGIRVCIPPRFRPAADAPPDPLLRCDEPWHWVYFRCDGGLAPCATFDARYGPWPADDLLEAWNSPAFVRLRRTVHTPAQPKRCVLCANQRVRDPRARQTHLATVVVPADAPG